MSGTGIRRRSAGARLSGRHGDRRRHHPVGIIIVEVLASAVTVAPNKQSRASLHGTCHNSQNDVSIFEGTTARDAKKNSMLATLALLAAQRPAAESNAREQYV